MNQSHWRCEYMAKVVITYKSTMKVKGQISKSNYDYNNSLICK